MWMVGIIHGQAETPDQLAEEALRANPELRYYESLLAGSAKGSPPVLTQPLNFRSAEALRDALLNQDKPLAALYLAEFRFALAAEVKLRAIAYQGTTESAAVATDLAARVQALAKMLEQRPAAGTESIIERRILEGASLPFVRTAATEKLEAEQGRLELNALLGRTPEAPLVVTDAFALPSPDDLPSPAQRLLMAQREAELARGLTGFDPITATEKFTAGGWFTQEGLGAFEPLETVTQPAGARTTQLERLRADAQRRLDRELARRTMAYRGALEVAQAAPPDLIKNLGAAAELADRQYRVGALSSNLLIEVNREWLDTLEARHEAVLQAWRNRLDLELLQLAAPTRAGKITVNP